MNGWTLAEGYDEGVSLDSGKEELAEYVRLWAGNGPLLDELRDHEIAHAETAASIRMFDLAFRIALRDLPLRDSSGLAEWQDFMSRLRRND